MPKLTDEIIKYTAHISKKAGNKTRKSKDDDDDFEQTNFTIKNNRNSVIIGDSIHGRIAFDGEKLQYGEIRCLTIGTTGSGKSFTTRNIIERLYEKKAGIQLVIDPEGEYYTLRKIYDFVILGTDEEYCDILITEQNAEELAIKMLKNKINVIIDLSFTDDKTRQEIASIYIDTIFNNPKYQTPTQLIIEEASKFASKGNPNPTNIKCTASLKKTAQQGRKRGISTFYNTQRITQLHKDISAECDSWIIGRCIDDLDVKRNGQKIGLKNPNELKSLKFEFFAWGSGFDHSNIDQAIKFKSYPPTSQHNRANRRDPDSYPVPESETVIKWIHLMGGTIKGNLKEILSESKKEKEQLSLLPEPQKIISDKIESIPKRNNNEDLELPLNDSCEICGRTAIAHNRCENHADYEESFGMNPNDVKWEDENDDDFDEDDED